MAVQYSGLKEQMYLQTAQEFHCGFVYDMVWDVCVCIIIREELIGLVYDMIWDVCVCIIIREELINTKKPSSLNFYNWTDKM